MYIKIMFFKFDKHASAQYACFKKHLNVEETFLTIVGSVISIEYCFSSR